MPQGTLIAESIRPGTSLDDLNLIVRQITRHAPDGTTDEQPPIWTDIYFEVDEQAAETWRRPHPEVLDPVLGTRTSGPRRDHRAPRQIVRYLARDAAGGQTPWRTAAPRSDHQPIGPAEAGWPVCRGGRRATAAAGTRGAAVAGPAIGVLRGDEGPARRCPLVPGSQQA